MVSAVSELLRERLGATSTTVMGKSLVFDEEEVPIDADKAARRSPPPLVDGNRIDPPVQEAENDQAENGNDPSVDHEQSSVSSSSNVESDTDNGKPRYRETSSEEESSSSDDESEYSYRGRNVRDAGPSEEASLEEEPQNRPFSQQDTSMANDAPVYAVAAAAGYGTANVPPQQGGFALQNGNRVVDLVDSPSRGIASHHNNMLAVSSPHRLPFMVASVHSSPSLLLASMPKSPRAQRRQSSTSPRPDRKVRRSSRESKKTDTLTVSTFSPTQKRGPSKKKRKRSKVYGLETSRDKDEWEEYGRIAREDDSKIFLHPATLPMDDTDTCEPVNKQGEQQVSKASKSKVYGEEHVSTGGPQYCEVQPLRVWHEESELRSQALRAKRQRLNDTTEFLADWLGTCEIETKRGFGRPFHKHNSKDDRMLDVLEDYMGFSVPVSVTGDQNACCAVFEESKSLAYRLKADYDKEGDDWCRKHFHLTCLPGGLLDTEVELAWLAEESLYCLKCHSWDWSYITLHASPQLQNLLVQESPVLVRPTFSRKFQAARTLIRNALEGGYRRPHMREIIQRHMHLTYLRQKEEEDSDSD